MRPTTTERGKGAEWRRIAAAFLAVHRLCQIPGCRRPATCVDHIVPWPIGSNDLSNLQALCQSCHSRKTVLRDGGFGRPRR